MPPTRYGLDSEARILRGGEVIFGGQPVRTMKLTPAGARLLERAVSGVLGSISRSETSLIERMVGAGILHPYPEPVSGAGSRTTIVIPALNEAGSIGKLVAAVAPGAAEVIVVDDGSRDGTAAAAEVVGARVIVHDQSHGPGAARNTGTNAAETQLVAFLDADCLPPSAGWIELLASHLEASGSALTAPRIVGAGPPAGSDSVAAKIASYERRSCPLDMGAFPSLAGPGRRVSFVPSAAMLIDRMTLIGIGGFDEELRYGEDVDLVWRLNDLGQVCRYEPAITVEHRSRPDLAGFARQRFQYGASAVELDRRHPGTVAPFQGSPTGLFSALATPYAGPFPVFANTLWSARRIKRTGAPLSPRESFGVALGGGLLSVGSLARALAREWLPLTIIAAFSKRLRRLALLAGAGLLADEARRSPGTLLTSLGLGLLARAAYSAGLWSAAVRARKLRALTPGLTGRGPA